MPNLDAGLTVAEVQAPMGRVCKSGHVPAPVFARDGGEPTPTKFFQVNSQGNPALNGVYCEPCLVIAHAIAKKQQQIR